MPTKKSKAVRPAVTMFRKVSIFGPGLLGGSLGMAIKAGKLAEKVAIWGRRPESIEEAIKLKAADEGSTDIEKVAKGADLIILATTIGAMEGIARQIAKVTKKKTLVTDVGSVKYPVVQALHHIFEDKASFVGSHPMAGSEATGIQAARPTLYQKAVCIITPKKESNTRSVEAVCRFWQALGMKVCTLSPQEHDEIVAAISHVPHLTASLLVNVACGSGRENIHQYCGNGFKDTTRIASGSPEMWQEIMLQNHHEIGRIIEKMIDDLMLVRSWLQNRDVVSLQSYLKRAKFLRDEIKFRS